MWRSTVDWARPMRVPACGTRFGGAVVIAFEPNTSVVCEDDLALLSVGERRRAAQMPPHRRQEFVRGRSLLRRLVAAELDAAPRRVPLAVSPGGALRLDGWPASVSLSHCAAWTVAAVTTGGGASVDVGVDVESPPHELDDRLVRRCLGSRAAALLANPPADRATAFAQVWAVQEACVKAVGLGLAGAPWRIPVEPAEHRGRWRDVSWRVLPFLRPTALAIATRPRPGRPAPTTRGMR